MREYTLKKRTIAIDSEVFMGIDAHKESLSVTLLVENQVIQRTIGNKIREVESLIEALPQCRIKAVYEAGADAEGILRGRG